MEIGVISGRRLKRRETYRMRSDSFVNCLVPSPLSEGANACPLDQSGVELGRIDVYCRRFRGRGDSPCAQMRDLIRLVFSAFSAKTGPRTS